MIQIEKTLLSRDIFEEEFVCNLSQCKGQCCVEGDAGAPLEDEEVDLLEKLFTDIAPFLRPEGVKAIEELGTSVIDFDGEKVTPLVNNAECAYVIFDEQGITKCGIEKAYEAGVINYKKPLSCHLYPIRIKKYTGFEALNYDRWPICHEACVLGKKLKISVLDFLEKPLIRKYGEKWYAECKEVQRELAEK